MAGDMEVIAPYEDIDSGKVLNKEGLLELSNQIKSYIDANSGGGNNTNIGWDEPIFSIISSGLINGFSLGGLPTHIETVGDLATALLTAKGGIIDGYTLYSGLTPKAINEAMGTDYGFRKLSITTSSSYITSTYYTSTNTSNLGISRKNIIFLLVGDTVFLAESLAIMRNVMGYNFASLIMLPTTDRINYTNNRLTTILPALDNAITNVATRIPSAPTTDGTYTLQCVVSSGTPTYSWVSV